MSKIVVVLLVVCGLFAGFAFASPVDEIIRLCEAGTAEDIVVTAAKQQPAVSLTVDQMLSVKKACKKGDAVLRALMQQPAAGEPSENKGSILSSTGAKAKSTPSAVGGAIGGLFKRGGGSEEAYGRQRLFIAAVSASVGGEEFADKTLADSIADIKGAAGKKFVVSDNEAEADFKLVLLGRQYEQVRATIMRHKTPRTEGILNCALYQREGEEWKPVVKLRSQSLYWKDAASKMISEVDKALR